MACSGKNRSTKHTYKPEYNSKIQIKNPYIIENKNQQNTNTQNTKTNDNYKLLNEFQRLENSQVQRSEPRYHENHIRIQYCSFCGEKVTEKSRYCPMCGNKISKLDLSNY
jgi:hypothetical protein